MRKYLILLLILILVTSVDAQVRRKKTKIGGKPTPSGSPADAQILIYDGVLGKWVYGANGSGGGGDMLKATYDTDDNGIVDDAESSQVLTGSQATDITNNNAKISYTDKPKVDNISVTQAVDLDQMEVDITTNNAKVGITAQQTTDITDNNTHKTRTDNPHSVTQAQVGLSNVDNTSDLNKPISTATQTQLDLKESIVNVNTKDQAILDDSKLYVQSRGMNLVTNGTFLYGDNTNFTFGVYEGSVANGTGGSVSRTSDNSSTTIDEFISINPEDSYIMQYDIKALADGNRAYGYITLFDIDKNAISPYYVLRKPGTDTRLAKALTPGDTYMVVDDATNWENVATAPYYRSLIIWGYKNSFGYRYPDYTYSRYWTTNMWDVGSVSNDTIYFNQGLPSSMGNPDDAGGTWEIGHAVSNGRSGSTYKYIAGSNFDVTTEWQTISGRIGGIDTTGQDYGNRFRYGTAFIKIGWLLNYNGSNTGSNTMYLTNISFEYADYRIKDVYDLTSDEVPLGIYNANGNASGSWLTLNPKDYGHNNDVYDTGVLFHNYSSSYKYNLWLDGSGGEFRFDNANTDINSKIVFRSTANHTNDEQLVIENDGDILVKERLTIGAITPDNKLDVNRVGDGVIIGLGSGGVQDGSISVAGGVVSYNAFVGSHYTQLKDRQKEPPLGAVVISTGEIITNKRYLITKDTVNFNNATVLLNKNQIYKVISKSIVDRTVLPDTTRRWNRRKGKWITKIKYPKKWIRKRILKPYVRYDEERGVYYRLRRNIKMEDTNYVRIMRNESITSPNEYFPYVKGVNKKRDKRVYGVWMGKLMDAKANKDFGDTSKAVYLVSQVGLYKVLVTNTNGNIKVGNFLETSSRKFYAQNQGDIWRRASTLCKAMVNVNWKNVKMDTNLGFKWKLIPAIF
jgi:hypothetical protein